MSLTEENPETMKAIRCPRCDSPDTKFCYYNNYSTTQPRHFCKNCKRYWTAGGSLRNVPVGGGLRKNKKTKMQANLDSKSKNKSDIDDVVATSSSSADEPLKPGPGSVKSTISPSLAFGQSPLKSDVVGGGGLGLGLGFPYEESPGAGHTSMMKRYPASDENTSYYTPHYPSHGMFSLPHNNGGIRATAPTPYSAPYEHSLGSLPSQPSEAIYGDNGGSSKRLRNNNGEISTAHLGSSEDSVAKSNNSGLFLYGGLSGTTSRLYDTNHHTGHSNNDNIEEPFLNWHQAGFSGATMPSLPPQGLVSDGQDNTQTSKGEEFVTPRGGVNFDDEDEGLGNVVNVRYPYDWEQVSEVLFGGTSDFFQIP